MPVSDWLRYLFFIRDLAGRLGLDAGRILQMGLAIVQAPDLLSRFQASRELLDYLLDAFERHLDNPQKITLSATSCLGADASHREAELVGWAAEQLGEVPAEGQIDAQAIDVDRIRRIIEQIAPILDLVLRLIGRN